MINKCQDNEKIQVVILLFICLASQVLRLQGTSIPSTKDSEIYLSDHLDWNPRSLYVKIDCEIYSASRIIYNSNINKLPFYYLKFFKNVI